jgi:hypothetical protein
METFQTKPKEWVWELRALALALASDARLTAYDEVVPYEKKEECQGVGGELLLRAGFLGA